MTELVHLDVAAGVATITLDSPDNRNALSAQLRRELSAHLDSAIDDDAVRVVVLAHTGRAFCAGMDLKEARDAGVEGRGVEGRGVEGRGAEGRGAEGRGAEGRGANEFPAILERIWNSPTPVVAKLAGPARAGGVGLVAACDIAVAAAEATFAFSEVRIGVVPAIISVTVLPRLLPRAAHELFLTGETFDAARALAVGLINSAVPADGLHAEVARYVEMLRLGAPGALAATKDLLRQSGTGTDLGAQFTAMQELSAGFFAGSEGQEGMAAFAEKRPPSWAGTP